jgi:CHAT domain-containing protein/tetratricopeptide (TPR) repeat protein
MRICCLCLGAALLLATARAQETTPAAPVPATQEQRTQPVETDSTRAMEKRVRECIEQANQLRRERKLTEARAAVRAASAEALAMPGRDQSELIERALEDLSGVAEALEDHEAIIPMLEACLAFRIAAQGGDASEVQSVRNNLGNAYWQTGDIARSRALLSQALVCLSRALPADDPRLNEAKSNFGVVQFKSGDYDGALATMSEVLASIEKTHAADDPSVQWAWGNVANVLDALGDREKALLYRERVHTVLSAALSAENPDLLTARENLGLALRKTGDPIGAKLLLASVLEVRERTLPPTSRKLDSSRQNLAGVLLDLGDAHGARILLEGVIARMEARVPDGDPALNNARESLQVVLSLLGEDERASALAEHCFEALRDSLGPEHPLTLGAMSRYASSLDDVGQLDAAYELSHAALESMYAAGPVDSPELTLAESANAVLLLKLGRAQEASQVQERILGRLVERRGAGDSAVLQAKARLAGAVEDIDPARSLVLLREIGAALVPNLAAAARALSRREAELLALRMGMLIDPIVARCRSQSDAALCFELVEASRSAAIASARSLRDQSRAAARDPAVEELRDALRRKSARLATLAEQGSRDAYQAEVVERSALESKLGDAIASYRVSAPFETRPAAIAAHLPEACAAVSYRRFRVDEHAGRAKAPPTIGFFALVLHRDGTVTRVELGPADAIERAVETWRRAIGVEGGEASDPRAAGEALRKLVLDPVLAAAPGAERLVIACDDVMHLVPFDALPRDEGVVGDKLAIELRPSLSALLPGAPRDPSAGELVALGGIDFDAAPVAGVTPHEERDADAPDSPTSRAPVLAMRSSVERVGSRPSRFTPLAASMDEVREIAALFEKQTAEHGGVTLLTGDKAVKDALIAAAPRARFLHVATHGFSSADASPWEGDRAAQDFAAEVRGISPSVLCGLALTGANLAVDAVHRTRGTLTAEELAYLELDGCELAVLSACDTNVGVRRAGVGIASLQSALHAAGARSTLTSLWKVPDASTRELMHAFYSGIWIDKLPKAQALWRAKNVLRERRAPLRDWAGWVLTGDAD